MTFRFKRRGHSLCLLFSISLLYSPVELAQEPPAHSRWMFFIERTQVQSPAVGTDGTIYIGTGLSDTSRQSDGVYAVKPDGTLKWKLTLGRTVHSSIAIDQQTNLFFIAGNGNSTNRMDAALYSLDSTGKLRWTFDSIGWMAPIPNTGFTPAIASGGTIYVNGRYALFAVNPDGTLKWTYDFPLIDNVVQSGELQSTGSHRSAPTIAQDGTIYVNTRRGGHEHTGVEGGVYAIDPNGHLKWRTYDVGGTAAPVIDKDGTIYSAVGRYENYADTSDWTAASLEARLLAIRPDGTLKWSVQTQLWCESSPSIGADGTLYIGTTHHPLNKPAWLHAITPEGQIKWTYDTYDDVKDNPYAQRNPPDIYNSPAIDSEGRVYFGNELGLFYAMTPEGTVAWRDNVSSLMYQSPALVSDGTLYISTHEKVDPDHYALIAMTTGSHGLANSPWPKFRQNNANAGNQFAWGPSAVTRHTTGPEASGLCENYPNPFNAMTNIRYSVGAVSSLPRAESRGQRSAGSEVRLAVYDLLGREVAVLVDEKKQPGNYNVTFDGSGLSSGFYFCRMCVGDHSLPSQQSLLQTRRLLLLR